MKIFLLYILFILTISKFEVIDITDNFDSYQNHSHCVSNWKSSTFGFEILNNQLVHIQEEFGILIWKKSEYAYDLHFELDVEVEKPYKTSDWEFVGAAIYKNENEYYAVQLVEHNSNGDRYPELKIVSDVKDIGKTISVLGGQYIWQNGKKYKLVIEIKEGNEGYTDENYISIIKAHIYENQDQLVYEHIYGITNKNALLFGKAAITSCYMKNQILKAYSKFSKISDYNPYNYFPEYKSNNYCSKTIKGYKLPKGKKTGFFHVEYFSDDKKWWIIDPLGNPTFMKGISHVNYFGVYDDKNHNYPYNENVRKKFNENEELWANSQKEILEEYGFNFLSIDSSKSMRHLGIPHSISHFSEEFSKKYDYIIKPENNMGLPNVFNPLFEEYLIYILEKDSEEYLNDPWVVGHFFDNELFWWGSTTFSTQNNYGLFSDIIILPSENLAKIELVNLIYDNLTKIYDSFEEGMLKVFEIENIKNKNDLLENKIRIEPKTDMAKSIANTFIRIIAEKYYKIVSSTIHKIDPNHIYLCDRFPGNIPFFTDIIEKYCDIVTINFYPIFDPYSGINDNINQQINSFHQKIKNRPLYITEWSVVALDVGLPSLIGAGLRVISQEQRAHSIQVLQLALASKDFIVGSDYFMFIDDSFESRENCNYGIKNEKDDTYDLMCSYFKKVNEQTCARHINGEYEDLYGFNNVDWINENNFKKIDKENFVGSRNINFDIDINNLLLIKYKNIILGNIHLLYKLDYQNETFWLELNTYKIENINENDNLYNLEITADSYYAKIKYIINIPKNFKDQENQPWFATKLYSFELYNEFKEFITLNSVCFLFNSSIGDDGKSNDIFGSQSSIPSFYQNNYFIYDKNIKLGLGILPHGINLKYGYNLEKINMEVVYNFENKIKVKANEIIQFDKNVKSQQIIFAPLDNIIIENPFSTHNETLYKVEKEIIKYVEPKNFNYEDGETGNYLYMVSINKILFYIGLFLLS